MWQGLILCSTLTLAGFGLANLPGLASKGISPLVFALLLGLVVGNLPLTHRLPSTQPGLTFATRWLLRGGIVLFGLSLTLQQVFVLGFKVLLLDLVVICSVLIIGYQIGTRILGMDRETTLLTSAGSAICGAAAVLATETVIRSRPAASSIAVATVVLFGTLGMLVYPLLYPLAGMNEGLFGVYIGATVHEVAQVVAAADAVGPEALASAVIVKMVRVILLLPFLLLVGQWWLRQQASDSGSAAGKPVIPWFAFGFIAMIVFNSVIHLPSGLHQILVLAGQVALTMAMAALGFETRIEKLKELGIRPFILGFILFGLLLVGGGLASQLLMG
ncbi:YeiH family protein [Vreelandella venusta]|uniref:YeiH family protein n=1 Tax=Vreelandella venusta TaxID=44935 RepID=UPI00200E2460|nr:putative sulfate exporter family transporter [Halomonas venusta]MDW0360135.1 putative sulfate exporter family transporter [Halomonas venusta]UQI40384.1 putative sulfate exporter family transporter [Halomonas venusta]